MGSSPVQYVRNAQLHENTDGSVLCADTGFWVDHAEPDAALRVVKERGIEWPFGKLPEGHEFLAIAKVSSRKYEN